MKNKVKLLERLKNKKTLEIIFVVVLILVSLIIFFTTFKTEKKSEITFNEYIESLENKLEKALTQVENVGKVSVVINVLSTQETVLAVETTITENGDSIKTVTTPIIVGGETVVLREEMPKITGVLIVAEGANNLLVKNKIINSTSTLLNINADKIEILTMK
ncbi:MAG: hypothetical protein E7342_02515 [Clostridiales bacterium]|nr:hypothetical protein [Clostridiales bacterium]